MHRAEATEGRGRCTGFQTGQNQQVRTERRLAENERIHDGSRAQRHGLHEAQGQAGKEGLTQPPPYGCPRGPLRGALPRAVPENNSAAFSRPGRKSLTASLLAVQIPRKWKQSATSDPGMPANLALLEERAWAGADSNELSVPGSHSGVDATRIHSNSTGHNSSLPCTSSNSSGSITPS